MRDSSQSRSKSKQEDKSVPPPKENKDNESNTCLYIGRFSTSVTNQQFKQVFEPYGQLEYCEITYKPSFNDEPKASRGFGFAKYVRPQDAARALSQLSGKDVFGRNCSITFSKRRKPREATPGQYLGPEKRATPRRRYSSEDSDRSYQRRRRRRHGRSSRSRSRSERRHRRKHERNRSRSRSKSRSRSRSRSNRRR